jgi:antirestriction protein ArdC
LARSRAKTSGKRYRGINTLVLWVAAMANGHSALPIFQTASKAIHARQDETDDIESAL